MQNSIRILLSDESELCKTMTNSFCDIGFICSCCTEDFDKVPTYINALKPDIVLFREQRPPHKQAHFLNELRLEFPDIKIITYSLAYDPETRKVISRCPIDGHFFMPMLAFEIEKKLLDMFLDKPFVVISHYLRKYLTKRGIAKRTTAFEYLLRAVMLVICDPDVLDRVAEFYSQLAEELGTTPSSVEHSIRREAARIGKLIYSKSSYTCRDILCVLADEFTTECDLYYTMTIDENEPPIMHI